ncbi:MAG: ADP-ribosylglycohydrolase family protein [Coprococcus sp.]
MSTYVMSDIHGCYDEFIQMLSKIQFNKEDILVCAGDYIDRGTKNFEMLNWIMHAPENVILVRGNHDEEYAANIDVMKSVCEKVGLDRNSIEDSKILYQAVCELAKQDGNSFFDYYGTIGKLINEELITFSELCVWADRIETMPYFYNITVNGRTCVVVHAGYIESLEGADTDESYNSLEEFYLYARDDAYMCGGIEHGMIIAGHTPTTADEEFPYNDGNVYRMYDEDLDCIFYDIDCGCSMSRLLENAKLACIRLDDEEIFYVGKSDDKNNKKLYLDGMMGLVVGDALGVPLEFASREELSANPVNEMMGYGTYPVPKGSWSDDSSMALASLAALHDEGVNLSKTMDNFVAWEQNGEFTPSGDVFDEGNTCSTAIYNYMKSGDITTCGARGEDSNGNGSLMRILPVCIYLKYLQDESDLDDNSAIEIIHNMSALTHAHIRSKMACGIYFFCVRELAKRTDSLQELLQTALEAAFSFYASDNESKQELTYFKRIKNVQELQAIPELQINSGGYVIESIEAALWSLLNTSSYEECVLKAVNLGHDTDTTAAIAGGLAGIYYGYENIPERWKQDIIRRQWIEGLCYSV